MRVLHIGKYFPPYRGGMEYFLSDLSFALARCPGVECDVVVHHHSPGKVKPGRETASSGASIGLYPVRTFGQLMFVPLSPGFFRALQRVIMLRSPDLLHIHMPNPSAFWLLSLPAARKIPWIIHWHSDVVASTEAWSLAAGYRFYRPFERRMLAQAHTVIATSDRYLESSLPLRDWQHKCRVLPLGADPERIGAGRDSGDACTEWQPGLRRILAVGRLTYYKGFDYLVRAMAKVEGAQLVIVGQGAKRQQLTDLIRKTDLKGRVKLIGDRSESQLAALLQSCDCLCLPSIERTEAFGMILLEAMAHGKATVISDVPGSGMGWVVEDGVTGVKVPPRDSEALAEALNGVLRDPEWAESLGQAGLTRFRQNFHIDRTAEKLMPIYRQVVTDAR